MDQKTWNSNSISLYSIHIQLNFVRSLLCDKSTIAILSLLNKPLETKEIVLIAESMIKSIEQSKNLPISIIEKMIFSVKNFLNSICIEGRLQTIQFSIKKMNNFIIFLKARKSTESEKSDLNDIFQLFDKIKHPVENTQEFSCDENFLRAFTDDFQRLLFLVSKFDKYSESLSRQFVTYSSIMEIIISEFFQINFIICGLNDLCSLLNEYVCEMQEKSFKDFSAELIQEPKCVFMKKPPSKELFYIPDC